MNKNKTKKMCRPGSRFARRLGLLTAMLLLAPFPGGAQESEDPAAAFVIVIHQDNPVTELAVKDVAKLFIRKTRRWPDGGAVTPIDRDPESEVRDAFTRAIHRKSIAAIERFWQRMIFSGDGVPPPEVASDKAVLDFVRKDPNAIGYVAAGTSLGTGVKTLKVQY